MSQSANKLELLRLYYRQGSFKKVLSECLVLLADKTTAEDSAFHLQIVRLAFQSSFELNLVPQVEPYLKEIEHLQSPWASFILGMWQLSNKEIQKAQEYFESSLQASIADMNHELTSRTLHALATVQVWKENLPAAEALVEKTLFLSRQLGLDEIESSALLLKANLLSRAHKIEEALDLLWKSYEIAKRGCYAHLQINILVYIAKVHSLAGNEKLTHAYAAVAIKGLDIENYPRVHALTESLLSASSSATKESDIKIDKEKLKARVRGKGYIEFGHQHILFDLLMLLATHPGKRFPKDELIGRVWKQMYNPAVHDNLIYVSVKRLRKILEPDEEAPVFVLRDRQGYYLPPQTTVEMTESEQLR